MLNESPNRIALSAACWLSRQTTMRSSTLMLLALLASVASADDMGKMYEVMEPWGGRQVADLQRLWGEPNLVETAPDGSSRVTYILLAADLLERAREVYDASDVEACRVEPDLCGAVEVVRYLYENGCSVAFIADPQGAIAGFTMTKTCAAELLVPYGDE